MVETKATQNNRGNKRYLAVFGLDGAGERQTTDGSGGPQRIASAAASHAAQHRRLLSVVGVMSLKMAKSQIFSKF